ncbi:MAG: FmdB family zinc ribbon protein [Actinomycetota bacterium]|nr:FmdB family zinc ribbon protein [Actinomycetota bacterium]MED5276516.1 FmdB family zinc ribbon protein [Actinomycetota bacterium]
MPTYIYRCQTCEKEFEIIQSIKDDPISECPAECSGVVKKVFSGVGISFKGSGFYKNDHGANSKKKPSSNTSNTTENKTSDSSSDTKNSDSNKASESTKKETKTSKDSSSSAS